MKNPECFFWHGGYMMTQVPCFTFPCGTVTYRPVLYNGGQAPGVLFVAVAARLPPPGDFLLAGQWQPALLSLPQRPEPAGKESMRRRQFETPRCFKILNDRRLAQVMENHPDPSEMWEWEQIAEEMGDGFSARQIIYRW
jgi:hypothetical protein